MSSPAHTDLPEPRISIIMPAYNAALFIRDAIMSVLSQSWTNWELIVINDGSNDDTADHVRSFTDPRIQLIEQQNKGVSAARNAGLDRAQGELVVFLDADDRLPMNSLRARATILLADPTVDLVDGAVCSWDTVSGRLRTIHSPSYKGPVYDRLIAMDPAVFFGPSWMVRRTAIGPMRLPTTFTHAEDLAFYISIAKGRIYACTPEVVLHYRVGHASAMGDLAGLHRGYIQLIGHVASTGAPAAALAYLRRRIRSILVRSYLKRLDLMGALRTAAFPLERSAPANGARSS